MRRISSHIPLILLLAAICSAGLMGATVASAATASGSPSLNKAALNQAVQEALSKRTGGSAGAQGGLGGVPSTEGQGSSEALSNLTKGGEEEPTQTTPTTTTSSSSGVSTGVLVPIFIVGAVMLGGIAFFIVRDARSVAPAGDGLAGGSSRDQAARLRKRRAKTKAARRQRKRNR